MHVISASRRTDIPTFYMPWLMNRLAAGAVQVPNPYNGQMYTVSLLPEDVHSIVFWSKNFAPFVPFYGELADRGYRFYAQYTITGGPRALEPHVPDWTRGVATFKQLAAQTSPRHVLWRFDPIVLTNELRPDFYLKRFREIAAALHGATERCTFSFATYYGKVARRLKLAGIAYQEPPLAVQQQMVAAMAAIAAEHGLTLYACCQEHLINGQVKQARCVDGDLLADLFPDRPLVKASKPTREGCGCVVSKDIGSYDTCPHGCLYCYANQSHSAALDTQRQHDPTSEALLTPA